MAENEWEPNDTELLLKRLTDADLSLHIVAFTLEGGGRTITVGDAPANEVHNGGRGSGRT